MKYTILQYGEIFDIVTVDDDGRTDVIKDLNRDDIIDYVCNTFEEPAVGDVELVGAVVDLGRLNEARWAACNTAYKGRRIPSMEDASAIADKIVQAYLGITPEKWEAQVADTDR